MFYVIDGRRTVSVGGDVYDVEPTSLVFAPAPLPHAVEAKDDSRMVVIYSRSPGRRGRKTGLIAAEEPAAQLCTSYSSRLMPSNAAVL